MFHLPSNRPGRREERPFSGSFFLSFQQHWNEPLSRVMDLILNCTIRFKTAAEVSASALSKGRPLFRRTSLECGVYLQCKSDLSGMVLCVSAVGCEFVVRTFFSEASPLVADGSRHEVMSSFLLPRPGEDERGEGRVEV